MKFDKVRDAFTLRPLTNAVYRWAWRWSFAARMVAETRGKISWQLAKRHSQNVMITAQWWNETPQEAADRMLRLWGYK